MIAICGVIESSHKNLLILIVLANQASEKCWNDTLLNDLETTHSTDTFPGASD